MDEVIDEDMLDESSGTKKAKHKRELVSLMETMVKISGRRSTVEDSEPIVATTRR